MKKILVAFSLFFIMIGCKKDVPMDTNNGITANSDINTWIHNTMSYYYLWNTNMPKITSTNLNDHPMNYFYSVLYDYGNTDRFSWIDSSATNLANQLESYRAMKVGKTAPDIRFTGDVFEKGLVIKNPSRLSEISAKYKVVIFGASWCTACSEEMVQLFPLYSKWKAKGLEVVFVSLDTDKTAFQNYTNVMPFISFCDYQQWNTQAAKDYYVSSSPTIYLLDKNNKIILRPRFVKAIDSWIDYNMDGFEKK